MTRAKPLPPDERRAAIIDAALPLLREHGRDFTTRQLAQAAGVAEGTIFRVFATIGEFQDAVIDRLIDATALVSSIEELPKDMPLLDLVSKLVTMLGDHTGDVRFVFAILLGHKEPASAERGGCRRTRYLASAQSVVASIADVLAPHAEALKLSPKETALLLRITATANTEFMSLRDDKRVFEPDLLADLFLNGATKETL